MAGFVDDFYMRLRILLPFIDTSAILVDVPLTRKAVWSERLKNAATEIESLAEKLDQVLLEIRDVLAKKQAIWEDISDSIGKMQRML